MPQQINLYSPIFLAPQRHFSARAMAQALGVVALALALLCAWAAWGSLALRRELAGLAGRDAQERERLVAALAAQPAASGPALTALAQDLARVNADLALRRRALDELERGLATPQSGHAARLRLVAQSLPPAAWLTGLTLADGRIELVGMTGRPEVLRPWLERLAQEPLTAGLPLSALKVERAGDEGWRFEIAGDAPGRPEAAR